MTPAPGEVGRLLDEVAAVDPFRYRDAPLPAPEDALVASVIERLAALAPPERDATATALLPYPLDQILQVYVVRCCDLALRTRDAELLRAAARALALHGAQDRETFLTVSAIWDAASQLGLDGDALLIEASTLATARGEALSNFARVPGKKVGAVGWKLVETRTGLLYRHVMEPTRGDEV